MFYPSILWCIYSTCQHYLATFVFSFRMLLSNLLPVHVKKKHKLLDLQRNYENQNLNVFPYRSDNINIRMECFTQTYVGVYIPHANVTLQLLLLASKCCWLIYSLFIKKTNYQIFKEIMKIQISQHLSCITVITLCIILVTRHSSRAKQQPSC